MIQNYKQEIFYIIEKFATTQEENLQKVAEVVVESMKNGGKFFAVGTGHSHMVGEEFYARAVPMRSVPVCFCSGSAPPSAIWVSKGSVNRPWQS